MKKMIYSAIVAGALSVSGTAKAVIVTGHFSGIITTGADHTNYVGLGNVHGALNGHEITGTISYDTSLAPADLNSDPIYGTYDSSGLPIWMPDIIVSIESVQVPLLQPSFPIQQIINHQEIHVFADGIADQFQIRLETAVRGGVDEKIEYDFYFRLFGMSVFSNDAIPLFLELSDFQSSLGGVDIYSSTSTGVDINIGLNFTLTSLSLAPAAPDPIPEPGTLALFGLGLTALGVMRRRRSALNRGLGCRDIAIRR